MREIQVVAGIVINNGKILCTQRGKCKQDEVSFKWEFPGGKIEEGETHQVALARELKEELELDVNVREFLCQVTYSYVGTQVTMFCYFCDTSNYQLTLNVHNDYKWLTISELSTLDWAPADKPVVEKLIQLNKV